MNAIQFLKKILQKCSSQNIQRRFHSSLSKNFIIYSISSLLCRGFTFLIAPITIVFLSPNEFGLLSLTNSFIVIMTIVMGLGLRNLLTLEYFHHEQEARGRLIATLIIIYLLIALPFFIVLVLNQSSINRYFFCNQSSTLLIIISLSICFFGFLIEFYQQILQCRTHISLAIKLQLTTALCSFLLTILFLTFFQWGVIGIITAQLIGMIGVYGKNFIRCSLHTIPSLQTIVHAIKKAQHYLPISIAFVPGMLCNWIMASGDRWFLAQYSNLHNVGIYTIADAFGTLFHILVSNSITAVYLPHILRGFAQNHDKLLAVEAKNKKIMYASMIGALLIITGGYGIGRPVLFFILPNAYHEAIGYIWFTFISYILLMGTYFASIFIQFHKKAYFLSFSLILPALLNIILNRLLIPHFAIYGCIGATITAYFFYFCITLWYNYKLQKQYKGAKRIIDKQLPIATPVPLSRISLYQDLVLSLKTLKQKDKQDF